MTKITFNRHEIQTDRMLGIHTSEIEEWDGVMIDYHRGEPTPYRGLHLFLENYLPLEDPFLIDYGSALGRINFSFHHHLQIPGIGLEVDPVRCRRAKENIKTYAKAKGIEPEEVNISFLQEKAEEYEPPAHANIFYFFHPFSDWIFRKTLERIIDSIDKVNRPVDLIFYYPSFQYFQAVDASGYFEELLFVDCNWNNDYRDGFWVFRHRVE